MGLLIIWGFASSIAQDMAIANLMYWLLWAGNYFVMWWSIPKLTAEWSFNKRLNLFLIPTISTSIGCLLTVQNISGGRLAGFSNPAFAALYLCVALILIISLYLTNYARKSLLIPCILILLILLFMTKTRGVIFATFSSFFAMLFARYFMISKKYSIRLIIQFSIIVLLIFSSIVFIKFKYAKSESLSSYLRIDGGTADLYDSRAVFWERGYDDFWKNGFLGRGFLSKYGDTENPRKIMGINIPRYDWNDTADPMSTLLLFNQQLGLPGLILFVLFIFSLCMAFFNLSLDMRIIYVGFLTITIIFLMEASLISFGDPIDRFLLILFSVLISHKSSTNHTK